MSDIRTDFPHLSDDDIIKLKELFAAYKKSLEKRVSYEEWQQRIRNN